jgi:hypothetical protein
MHIHDMIAISGMTWVAVGSDSGVFLYNTIEDFARWEKVVGHPTFKLASDTAIITSLICAATFDGLWEWRQNQTGVRTTPMTRP